MRDFLPGALSDVCEQAIALNRQPRLARNMADGAHETGDLFH
jgi:hypothetical protein